MTSSSSKDIFDLNSVSTTITKVAPKAPPTLIENWVIWEYTASLCTNGVKLELGHLHDLLKLELEKHRTPVDIFFTDHACWIIEGARGRAKVDEDRRPRVVATLRNSIYTDIQFITGLDYYGDHWANFQMMLIVQPEIIEEPAYPNLPPRPVSPSEPNLSPLIPNEALLIMAIVAGTLIFTGNIGLQVLGLVGFFGGVIIWFKSTSDIRKARESYEKNLIKYRQSEEEWKILKDKSETKWADEKKKIALEREELQKNRLSRSFKWDDLRIFHEVMITSVAKIVYQNLIEAGAKVKETTEMNQVKDIIPESKKNIFDDF